MLLISVSESDLPTASTKEDSLDSWYDHEAADCALPPFNYEATSQNEMPASAVNAHLPPCMQMELPTSTQQPSITLTEGTHCGCMSTWEHLSNMDQLLDLSVKMSHALLHICRMKIYRGVCAQRISTSVPLSLSSNNLRHIATTSYVVWRTSKTAFKCSEKATHHCPVPINDPKWSSYFQDKTRQGAESTLKKLTKAKALPKKKKISSMFIKEENTSFNPQGYTPLQGFNINIL